MHAPIGRNHQAGKTVLFATRAVRPVKNFGLPSFGSPSSAKKSSNPIATATTKKKVLKKDSAVKKKVAPKAKLEKKVAPSLKLKKKVVPSPKLKKKVAPSPKLKKKQVKAAPTGSGGPPAFLNLYNGSSSKLGKYPELKPYVNTIKRNPYQNNVIV